MKSLVIPSIFKAIDQFSGPIQKMAQKSDAAFARMERNMRKVSKTAGNGVTLVKFIVDQEPNKKPTLKKEQPMQTVIRLQDSRKQPKIKNRIQLKFDLPKKVNNQNTQPYSMKMRRKLKLLTLGGMV